MSALSRKVAAKKSFTIWFIAFTQENTRVYTCLKNGYTSKIKQPMGSTPYR